MRKYKKIYFLSMKRHKIYILYHFKIYIKCKDFNFVFNHNDVNKNHFIIFMSILKIDFNHIRPLTETEAVLCRLYFNSKKNCKFRVSIPHTSDPLDL